MPALADKTEQGEIGGIWEVKWTWLPVFLSQDADLVRQIDVQLNELFAGGDIPRPGVIDSVIVKAICKKYPMDGLREALEAIRAIDPTIRLKLVDDISVTETLQVVGKEQPCSSE